MREVVTAGLGFDILIELAGEGNKCLRRDSAAFGFAEVGGLYGLEHLRLGA